MQQNTFSLLRSKSRVLREYFRRKYFKLAGLKLGDGGLFGNISCEWPGSVSIGKECTIQDEVSFWIKNPFSPNNFITVGDRVFIGRRCEFNCNSSIKIGNDCLIASNTIFVDISHGMDPTSNMNIQDCNIADIVLENDVWVGTSCTVLKGVTIGTGSIIGAGSVVNRSIPPFEIWAGSPAKFIKKRA